VEVADLPEVAATTTTATAPPQTGAARRATATATGFGAKAAKRLRTGTDSTKVKGPSTPTSRSGRRMPAGTSSRTCSTRCRSSSKRSATSQTTALRGVTLQRRFSHGCQLAPYCSELRFILERCVIADRRHPRLHGSASCSAWFLSVFPPQCEAATSGAADLRLPGGRSSAEQSCREPFLPMGDVSCLPSSSPCWDRKELSPLAAVPRAAQECSPWRESVALNRAAKQELPGPYCNEQRFIFERWRNR
jgi:hypothetical protein